MTAEKVSDQICNVALLRMRIVNDKQKRDAWVLWCGSCSGLKCMWYHAISVSWSGTGCREDEATVNAQLVPSVMIALNRRKPCMTLNIIGINSFTTGLRIHFLEFEVL